MKLADATIEIRQRSYGEILDLTVQILRRNGFGLLLCFAIGIAPILLINSLLHEAFVEAPMLWFWVVLMEMPWATAPLTLYLGQATFQRRVVPRQLLADGWSCLPSMLLYQFLWRGLCVLIPFAWPILIARWRYMNEMVLLERERWGRARKRYRSFHRSSLGESFGHFALDFLVGSVLLTVFIYGLWQLWSLITDTGGFRLDGWSLETIDDPFALWLGWKVQLPLWVLFAFFAVVRFFDYLDLRIRREGWDVELKLRRLGQRLAVEQW